MTLRTHTVLAAVALLAATLLSSCAHQQEYAYFKNVPRHIPIPVEHTYNSTILPDDQLYIEVFSQSPQSTLPFNQNHTATLPNSPAASFMADTLHAANTRGYLVADDGTIMFPIIGRVQAAGLTLDSLGNLLSQTLRQGNYVTDALVTVKLMNFRVAVIGEVRRPSELHGDGLRMTIFEALAQCGDVTMDGMRDKVVIVRRSPTGGQTVDTVDLTSRAILESPYYYLQQGDIVFVSPTEKRRRQAYRNDDWPQYVSTGVSGLRLAYTTIRTIALLERDRQRNR